MLARSRRTLAPVMPPQGAAPRLVSSPFPELCTSWSLPQRNCASAHESLPRSHHLLVAAPRISCSPARPCTRWPPLAGTPRHGTRHLLGLSRLPVGAARRRRRLRRRADTAGRMVKQRLSTADVAGECACLRRCLGMRLANVYDINAKARWLAGGGGLG